MNLRGGQPYGCGREAAFALADFVRGRNVTCLRRDTDRYGRMVGVCTVGGVEQGWALPYAQYGGAVYQGAERQAKAGRKGLHVGTYQNPWDYRKSPQNPVSAGTPRTAAATSTIYKNCAAVRAAGAAPIRHGQPGYGRHLDRDGDGVGCE